MVSLDLYIGHGLSCGGNNVYIELNQGQKRCRTAHKWHFYRGDVLSWTGYGVNNCLRTDFNVDKDIINFKIRSTDGNDFCPKSLSIVMDSGDVYMNDNMNGWVDKNHGNFNRVATRIPRMY